VECPEAAVLRYVDVSAVVSNISHVDCADTTAAIT
jgi:hypothetical protein